VRWMSPESLVDGVFTTQSDIWYLFYTLWKEYLNSDGQQFHQ
jgi:hypothetical protein